METNTTSRKAEAKIIEASFGPAGYTTLFNRGLERVVGMSKSSLNSAVEQNSEVLDSCKQALKASSRSGLFLVDLAGHALEGQLTLQRSLLDLTVGRNTAVAEEAHDQIHDFGNAKAGITDPIQQPEDRTITPRNLQVVFRRIPPTPRIRAVS
jgi:hypothetical protein